MRWRIARSGPPPGADQPQQHPVEDLSRGVGELGGFLLGEPVQRAADATHLVVASEGQGLAALRLPQLRQGELQHRQRTPGGVAENLINQPRLKATPRAAAGRSTAWRICSAVRGDSRYSRSFSRVWKPGMDCKAGRKSARKVSTSRHAVGSAQAAGAAGRAGPDPGVLPVASSSSNWSTTTSNGRLSLRRNRATGPNPSARSRRSRAGTPQA